MAALLLRQGPDMCDSLGRHPDLSTTSWLALVDGANHQIERIKFKARKREVKVTIVVGTS